MPKDYLQELNLLIRSRYGLIGIDSLEEDRVRTLVRHLADQLNLPLFFWSHSSGLQRDGESSSIYNTHRLPHALTHIRSSSLPAVNVLLSPGPDLEDPTTQSLLKELADRFSTQDGALLIVEAALTLSDGIKPHVGLFRLPPPRPDEFKRLLQHLVRDLRKSMNVEVRLTASDLQALLRNLHGLTLLEAEKILTKAIIIDEALTADDIRRVIDAKKDIVERDGLLEYYPVEETMADISGLSRLKDWLRKRRATIQAPDRAKEAGLTFPKGMLLLGVPGTGKSLTAKAVAMEWSLPLLKMDPASLYNKYMGETEKNFRRAMEIAEKMSPVVLWIDEIEKAFAGSGDMDGGASVRVLGTFLSWLQDRAGDVFVVATANDVSRLPPELLRKGRFDEVFFVDLPNTEVRADIYRSNLRQRDIHLNSDAYLRLGEQSEGFSGAEIAQVVLSALHTAFAHNVALNEELLLSETEQTVPLSITMKERIDELRRWASTRTIPAD